MITTTRPPVVLVVLGFFRHLTRIIQSNFYSSVGQWAERFGEELWELGQKMTKSSEIKAVCISQPQETQKLSFLIISEIQTIQFTC